MLYLTILLIFVFFAGIAMTVNEGLWSNTISLFCILFAALLAWDWGRVLGGFVIEQVEPSAQNTWAFWFASIWGVFFLSITILRVIADRSSRVRMRFIMPLDRAGGLLMGLGVAVMFTSFTAYSLYIPFKAGVWKFNEGAAWQQQIISTATRPIFGAGKAVYGDDFPDVAR